MGNEWFSAVLLGYIGSYFARVFENCLLNIMFDLIGSSYFGLAWTDHLGGLEMGFGDMSHQAPTAVVVWVVCWPMLE